MDNENRATDFMQIKVGIIGAAGYTGGELIRLLINHPHVKIIYAHSKSNAGKAIHEVHGDLVGVTDLRFSPAPESMEEIDLLFLCVGHGEAREFLSKNNIDPTIRIIDLSQDFRLALKASYADGKFIYGLPELNKEELRAAKMVANPGCFATAIQLGILPLAKAGILREVYTTGITGSTGAGQGLSATSHFSWRANNIQAYKTLTHQHLSEIGESLQKLQPEHLINVHFVPWRGDFTRGIFVSSTIPADQPHAELLSLYKDYYKEHPFVAISEQPISLKQVVNTNKCLLQLEKEDGHLVVHSALDNLLKGASGQAVQNMNLMFGLDETEGLKLKANYY